MTDERAAEGGRAAVAWARAGAVAASLFALDQAAKAVVVATVAPGESTSIFFGLDLTYVRNTGIAFGALADGGAVIPVLVCAALALLAAYFARHPERPWLWLPVGAVAGGALGNLADRLRDGTVIDFIDPVAWPAFNLADVFVVLGVLGILYLASGPRAAAPGRP